MSLARRLASLLLLCLATSSCALLRPAPAPEPAPPSTPPAAQTDRRLTVPLPSPLVLSVLYFEDRAQVANLRWLSKGLPDLLVAELARRPSLIVVQRDRLDEVIHEQSLHLTGRVADESTVRVGRLIGATVLVTGSFTVVNRTLRLQAQFISVEQGTVLGTARAEGPIDDPAAVAHALVTKVLGMLQGTGPEIAPTPEREKNLLTAVTANASGESLSRKDKLFQALREYERARAADPTYGLAQSNYSKTVKTLSGWDIVRPNAAGVPVANDNQVAERIAERLVGSGFEPEFGALRLEQKFDDTMIVVVPVQMRLSSTAVDNVLESAGLLGGELSAGATGDGPVVLRFSDKQHLNERLIRRLSEPRRIYLRLVARNGVTLGIYSNFRDWQVRNWVYPAEEQRVRIERQLTLSGEARFTGLSPAQVRRIAAVNLSVKPVPKERATIRIETRDRPAERVDGEPPSQLPSEVEQGRSNSDGDAAFREQLDLQALQTTLEHAWIPPITERPWTHGYLPGNERRTVVGLGLREDGVGVRAQPRLVRKSGDRSFDDACMAAASIAAAQAAEALTNGVGVIRPSQTNSARDLQPSSPRVLVQCRLIKDLPALNLIESQATAHPLALRGTAPKKD